MVIWEAQALLFGPTEGAIGLQAQLN